MKFKPKYVFSPLRTIYLSGWHCLGLVSLYRRVTTTQNLTPSCFHCLCRALAHHSLCVYKLCARYTIYKLHRVRSFWYNLILVQDKNLMILFIYSILNVCYAESYEERREGIQEKWCKPHWKQRLYDTSWPLEIKCRYSRI